MGLSGPRTNAEKVAVGACQQYSPILQLTITVILEFLPGVHPVVPLAP
jgi:hypothetical protein